MWGFLIKTLYTFFYNLLIVLIGESMIQWAFFKTARWVTSKTPTKVDDEFIEKLEDSYKRSKGD